MPDATDPNPAAVLPMPDVQLSAAIIPDDGLLCLGMTGGGEFKPYPAGLEGYPAEVSGVPAHYRTKDIVHKGFFRHPIQGFDVPIDHKRMDHWVKQFDAMALNGVKVYVPDDHSAKAKDNNGWVKKMWRDGDDLKALFQFIGQSSLEKAAKNEVSVGIRDSLTDGKQNTYTDVLEHVALTPVPVIPDQQEFLKAASRAAATPADPKNPAAVQPERSPTMAQKMLPCSAETESALHKHVPGLDKADDAEKLSRLAQHLQTCAANDDADAGGPAAVANMSREQIITTATANRANRAAEVSRLTASLAESNGKVAELSRQVVKPLDTESEAAMVEAVTTKLDTAVARGGITPFVRDLCLSLMVKDATGKVNTMALSRAANPTGTKPLALALADALCQNKPVPLGTQTGVQTLDRSEPDADPKGKNREAAKKMMDKYLAV